MVLRGLAVWFAILLASTVTPLTRAQAPVTSDIDRQRAQQMLKVVSDDVCKHYFDPKFHGVDFDKEVADAKQRIEKVTTLNMALANIAAALDSLDDSHTFFLPPSHPLRLATAGNTRSSESAASLPKFVPPATRKAKG